LHETANKQVGAAAIGRRCNGGRLVFVNDPRAQKVERSHLAPLTPLLTKSAPIHWTMPALRVGTENIHEPSLRAKVRAHGTGSADCAARHGPSRRSPLTLGAGVRFRLERLNFG